MTAGHSVGEITAAAFAGVLSDHDAMVFVRERGPGMAAASALTPTGMSAVLGGDPDEVAEVLARHGLTAANANGAGQTVAAGTLDQLAALAAEPARQGPGHPAAGRRRLPHQPHGPRGRGAGRAAPPTSTSATPASRCCPTPTARPSASGADALTRLVRQVSSPVRWDLCMQTLVDLGVTAVIELPPAGTLVGLAKRAMPGVATLAVKTPDDLEAAHAADPRARRRPRRPPVSTPDDAQEA